MFFLVVVDVNDNTPTFVSTPYLARIAEVRIFSTQNIKAVFRCVRNQPKDFFGHLINVYSMNVKKKCLFVARLWTFQHTFCHPCKFAPFSFSEIKSLSPSLAIKLQCTLAEPYSCQSLIYIIYSQDKRLNCYRQSQQLKFICINYMFRFRMTPLVTL